MQNNITNALLSLLNKGIVKFTYRKVDGTIRKAIGTRNLDAARSAFGIYIPTPKTGRNNPTAYYDIEKEGWRSFVAENVLSINDVDIKEIKGVSGGRIVKVNEPTEVEIPINVGGGIGVGMGFGGGIPKEEIHKAIEKLDKDIEIPIGKGGGVGFGIPIGGGIGGSHKDNEPKNFDLGKIGKAIGGMVGTPTFEKRGIALPIEGVGGGTITIDDFAKLVAKYVVAELADRLVR